MITLHSIYFVSGEIMIGKKQDKGKTRWDLIEWNCMEEVAEVLTMGAEKYEEDNWKYVSMSNDRYFAALMRHIVEWKKGSVVDGESGKSHLAHAICNCMFLMYFDNLREEEEENKNKNG